MTDQRISPLPPEIADLLAVMTDPVERMLLTGEATTVFEAEEKFLDSSYPEALSLLASSLSDEKLAEHPLFRLYRSYGSPSREDSLL
jgi:hypothetical protein